MGTRDGKILLTREDWTRAALGAIGEGGVKAVAVERLAKTLTAFMKNAPTLQIKAAVVQGQAIKGAEVTALATMPGKPELYAKLLFLLQAPMQQLVSVLAAPAAMAGHPPEIFCGTMKTGQLCSLGTATLLGLTPENREAWLTAVRAYNREVNAAITRLQAQAMPPEQQPIVDRDYVVVVDRLNRFWVTALGTRAIVRVQGPAEAERVASKVLDTLREPYRLEGRELFANPRMPYTKMLLGAVPDLAMSGRQRIPVKGEIPNPIDPPPGCASTRSSRGTARARRR